MVTAARPHLGISVDDRAYRELYGVDMDSPVPVDPLVVPVGQWYDRLACERCGLDDLEIFRRLARAGAGEGPAICYLCMWPELAYNPEPAEPEPPPGPVQGAMF